MEKKVDGNMAKKNMSVRKNKVNMNKKLISYTSKKR